MAYQWMLKESLLFEDGEYALGVVMGEIDEALIEHVSAAEGLEMATALDREDYAAVSVIVVAALRRANERRVAQESQKVLLRLIA
jgi:hypothetical protein